MAVPWTESQLIAAGFEPVLAELEQYDGPRAGLALISGAPHYFRGAGRNYQIWPARADIVELEREQWQIFVTWNQRYEAGDAGPDSHPGHDGPGTRYYELTELLTPHRRLPHCRLPHCRLPHHASHRTAELRFDNGPRYRPDGVDYWFRWRPGG